MTIPQILRKRLRYLMILYLLVPAPIFCQTSPSPLSPAATAQSSPAPLAIPIPPDVFAKLLKENPFQVLLDYIRSTNNRKPEILPLAAAISSVQKALEKYKRVEQEQQDYDRSHSSKKSKNDLTSAGLPDLASAEFGFKVTQSTTFGGTLSWVIITIGATRQDQNVNEATFTYTVPTLKESSGQAPLTAVETYRLEEDLVPALQQAALAAGNEFTWEGKKFNQKITITLQYGVEVKLDVGASIPVYTLTVGPKASWNNSAVQSVKLVFEKKAN